MGQIDAFRFWVGTKDERWSSVWKIWERNGQIYALTTSLSGRSKLSIHSPDTCQFGLEREFRQKRGYANSLAGIPTFVRWKRAPAIAGNAVPLAVLQFPTDFLRGRKPAPAPRTKKFQGFLEPAPTGQCVELLFVAVKNPGTVEPLVTKGAGYKSIVEMSLGGLERCLVVGRHCGFNPDFVPIDKQIDIPNEWIPLHAQGLNSGDKVTDQNLLIWNHPNDFEPIVIAEVTGVTLTKNHERQVPRNDGEH